MKWFFPRCEDATAVGLFENWVDRPDDGLRGLVLADRLDELDRPKHADFVRLLAAPLRWRSGKPQRVPLPRRHVGPLEVREWVRSCTPARVVAAFVRGMVELAPLMDLPPLPEELRVDGVLRAAVRVGRKLNPPRPGWNVAMGGTSLLNRGAVSWFGWRQQFATGPGRTATLLDGLVWALLSVRPKLAADIHDAERLACGVLDAALRVNHPSIPPYLNSAGPSRHPREVTRRRQARNPNQ